MPNIKYYATTISGIERVSWQEMQSKLDGAILTEEQKGRIAFTYEGEPKELLNIRTAENIYAHVGTVSELTRSRNSLGEIFRQVSNYNLDIPLRIHKDFHGGKGKKRLTFRVFSTMMGRHNFRRVDAQSAVESAITKKYDWKLSHDSPTLVFQLDIDEDIALIGLKLTDERIHRWKYKVSHVPASLNPSVAHCMILLSDPAPSDIFVDPMCGAGTIAIERAYANRYHLVIAGDVQESIIKSAKSNIESSRRKIDAIQWDVAFLPLQDHSVDKIVCNLPFGRQTGSQPENQKLYINFFKEIRRIMKSQGKCVLLTVERKLIDDIVFNYRSIKINRRLNIDLSGLKAYIYVLHFL
ncbi:MAG: methyltransferase [Candidatus Poribacteria bacterium]